MSSTDTRGTIVKEIAIKAGAERVFRAFTDPQERLRWWGANGTYHGTENESDLRVGGKWLSRGVSADGTTYCVSGEYLEIDRPRLLVFTWLHDWEKDAPHTVVRLELNELAGTTVVRLTHSGFSVESSRADHDRGWDRVMVWLQAFVEEGVGYRDRPPEAPGS